MNRFSHPIIILGPALPAERSTIAERGFIPTISALEEAEDFNRVAHRSPVTVNFKIDTGMGRMGVPEGEALDVLKKVSTFPNIRIHSVSTHLPVSGEDAGYTRDQLFRFGEIMKQFRAAVPIDYKAHVLQSAGVLAFAEPAGVFDMVRAGIVLYGISPLSEFQNLLKPVMTWKTRHLSGARHAEGKFHQLWPHVYHSSENAGRNLVGWLRRRISMAPF